MEVIINRQRIFGAENFPIPVAEEILAADYAAIRGQEWDLTLLSCADRLVGGLPLHINVYPATFPLLLEMEKDLPITTLKDDLVIEVVENGINGHLPDIKRFAELGYRIALDDFGKRESNYCLLNKLPPSLMPVVKIDMDLLHRFSADHVMSLGRELRQRGYTVYLEGVQEPGHMLPEVDGYQGFLLHRPAPAGLSIPDIETRYV